MIVLSAIKITKFQDQYRFLSNFWRVPIEVDGIIYATVEHYFQSQKASTADGAKLIASATSPKEAKRLGKTVEMRGDWEQVKLGVMERGVRAKFEQHPDLARKLMETGDALLEEGNLWGDIFWGVDARTGNGKNHLGKILMQVREDMKNKFPA